MVITRRVKQTNHRQAYLESVLPNSVEEEDKRHVFRNERNEWGSGTDISKVASVRPPQATAP